VPGPRRGIVPRPRLEDRLDRAALPAVTLVSAPAGFGKSTLLAEWAAGDGPGAGATAWLSLDARDNDPALFWTYVVAALRTVVPGVGASALAALQAAPAALEHVVAALLNDLVQRGTEVVLVLDDHHLIESIELHESMRFALEHLPAQLRLVVATRADPPWPLSGLRARGELRELRAADLRFTGEEAATYLNGPMGLGLGAAEIGALEARTEGWIAALQLAALSLRDRDDPAAFIAGFAGDDRFVVDYLVDEVLDRLAPEVRAFLLETSVLGRLTAPLCAAVTGRDDARAILDSLERSNLFVVPLDDRRQWYRYHHLFGDVLRMRLADEHPERVPALHGRAAEWFEAAGDRAEAIRHALAAGAFPRAAELIERTLPALRRARHDVTYRTWIEALPPEIFATHPVLDLARVGSHMVFGRIEGVAALLDDVEARLGADPPARDVVVHDHEEFRRLPAQAATFRAALALLTGDLAATLAHAERAARLSAADDHLGRGAAAALIGLARWADGDLEAAERQYTAAVAAFEAAGYLADILGCSRGLADVQAARGRLGAAERSLRRGLELAAAHAPLRGTPDIHVGLAELHLERDERDACAEHLRAGAELGEGLALAQYPYRRRVVEARLRAARGDVAGALELLREAEARYDTDFSPRARPVAATTARVQLAGGDLDAAARWAAAARVGAGDAPTYLREYEHLTLARLLLAQGRAGAAAALLQRLLAAAEAGGREGSAIEALALLALAHAARADTPAALAALEDALTRAAPERHVRVFLDAGAPMTALLRTAARHGRSAARATALLDAAAAPARSPAARDGADELSDRERDVLRLLRTELSGPEIAAELFVSLNTLRSHTKRIYAKLGVSSRRAAVRRAGELGL
jgi:LuxR family maltose regulon positive regulatory protein